MSIHSKQIIILKKRNDTDKRYVFDNTSTYKSGNTDMFHYIHRIIEPYYETTAVLINGKKVWDLDTGFTEEFLKFELAHNLSK